MFALEWPLPLLAGSGFHRSLEVRLALLPLTALAAVLIYQGTNAALYYLIGMMVYFWAYSEGEVSPIVVLGEILRVLLLTGVVDYLCEAVDSTPARGPRIEGLELPRVCEVLDVPASFVLGLGVPVNRTRTPKTQRGAPVTPVWEDKGRPYVRWSHE